MIDLITEPIDFPVQAKVTGEISFLCQGENCDGDVIVNLTRKPLHEALAEIEEETRGLCSTCLRNYEFNINKHFHTNH